MVPTDVATAVPAVCVILPKFALGMSLMGFAKFVWLKEEAGAAWSSSLD